MTTSPNTNILNLYHMGDFEKLSQHDLGTAIDSNGNTIIHIIATNLDKNALKELVKFNSKCITYSNINKPNKHETCPLHNALETINKSNNPDHSFVTYMIDKLNADPSIPDKEGRIIAKSTGLTSEPGSESKTENIPKIIKSCGKNHNENDNESYIKNTIKFIRDITNHYANIKNTKPVQTGGFKGHRMIKSATTSLSDTPTFTSKFKRTFSTESDILELSDRLFESDLFTESGTNDTFQTKFATALNQYEYMTSTQDRPKRDPEVTAKYNKILERIMELLGLDEEKAKMYRSIIKLYLERTNPELKGSVNDALKIKEMEKIVENKKKLTEYWDKKVSPHMEEIKSHMETQAKLGEERKKEIESKPKSKPKPKSKSKSKSKSKPKVTESEFLSNSESEFDRPKHSSTQNDRYLNILKKIKEYMGLDPSISGKIEEFIGVELQPTDDQTARECRTIIKLYVKKNNRNEFDELSEDQKEDHQLELMEAIVSDESTFKEFWNDKISSQIKSIKAYMAKQAEKGEERRKEAKQQNKREKPNMTSSLGIGTVSTSESESESESPPKKKAKKEPKAKAKKPEKKPEKSKKVAKNGYIESDELIFSSE